MHLAPLVLALPATQLSQSPELLTDINATSLGTQNGSLERLVELGGSLWLTSRDNLWRFDPASGEAWQLTDSFDTSGSTAPAGPGRYVQRLGETTGVNRMIGTDGTPGGTEILVGTSVSTLRSDPFVWAGNTYFFGSIESDDLELWRTDGTSAGTVLVDSFGGGPFWANEVDFAVFNDTLLVARQTQSGLIAFSSPSSPGVEIGTGGFFTPELAGGVPLGSRFCFSASPTGASGQEPWITDGTPSGTFQLANLNGAFGGDPEFVASDANRAWFSAVDNDTGRELYVTSGTPGSTRLVTDLATGYTQGIPSFGFNPGKDPAPVAIVLPDGDLLFSGSNDTSFGGIQQNFELWRTDGTAPGTTLVADLNPGLGGAEPTGFVEHNGLVYFAADLPGVGRELLVTDGTPQGTALAFELSPGVGSSSPRPWSAAGELFIAATNPDLGRELFRYGGPGTSVSLAYEFAPQTTDDAFGLGGFRALRLGDDILFGAEGTDVGYELFATDGTPEGTRLVADVTPGPTGSKPLELGVTLGDRAVFAAGGRLYITDGSTAGTLALTDPTTALNPGEIVRIQNRVVFTAGSFSERQLWGTDGTPEGTTPLGDVQTNYYGQIDGPRDSAELDGFLYFNGRGPSGVPAVWRTDGTPAGTEHYADVPNTGLKEPFGFLRDADQLLFFADRDNQEFWYDLWSLDGTPGGATPLFGVNFSPHEAHRLGAGHVIVPENGAYGEFWYTDGTPAGTQVLEDFLPDFSVSIPKNFVRIGERLYFVAALGLGEGEGWWSTDGTPSGTLPVPTDQSLYLDSFAVHDALGTLDVLVYGAGEDEGFGYELWQHDPATGAQERLTDIFPGAASSRPTSSVELNGRLLFTADNPEVGRELWAIDLNAAGAPSSATAAPACGLAGHASMLELVGDASPGGSFDLRVSQAPPGTLVDTYYSLPTTWLDLGQGCISMLDLLTAVPLASQVTDITGTATTTLTVPSAPALAGLALSIQGIVLEAGGPLFGAAGTTNGLDVVFGS